MQRRVETMPAKAKEDEGVPGESNTNVEDMEEDSSSSDDDSDDDDDKEAPAGGAGKTMLAGVDAAPAVNQPMPPPPSLPTPGNVEVRQYDPKQAKAAKKAAAPAAEAGASEQYLVSPITGERVPASKVQEHMRIGLLDPRWVEERDKQITARASEDAVFAPGQAIESSLKQLAERRTDIFGVGEEAAQEAAIGKKMGEEENRAGKIMEDGTVVDAPPKVVTWDGHSSSADSAAAKARASVTLSEQIEQIHRQKEQMAELDKIGPKSGGDPVATTSAAPSSSAAAVVSAPPQPPSVRGAAPPQMPPQMPPAPMPGVPPAIPMPPQQPPMMVGGPPPVPVMPGLPGGPPQPFFVASAPG